MGSKLFFSLGDIKPRQSGPGGSIISVTGQQVPGFHNISFESVKLNAGYLQQPIWHPNANKMGVCMQGKGVVSIRSPGEADQFPIAAGDVFFVPKGFVHHIANTGDGELEIHFAFDHSEPEEMRLSNAIGSLSEDVFHATFHAPSGFLDGLKKYEKEELIHAVPSREAKASTNAYKFNIANSPKTILTEGGYLQQATKPNLHVLEGVGLLGFGLNPKGAVEPHWHTNAGELVYIVKGHTRITVLAPDGSVESLEVKGGQGAFAPASHFHNIVNVGDDPVEVLAFFNHAEPDYIGIGEVVGSFSNEVLASVFNVSPEYFASLDKSANPLVIVPS